MAVDKQKFDNLVAKLWSVDAVLKAFSNKYWDNSSELKTIQNYVNQDNWSNNQSWMPASWNAPKFSDPNHQQYYESLSEAWKKSFYDQFLANNKASWWKDPNSAFNNTANNFTDDKTSDYMASFDKWYSDYTKTQTDAYNIQTQRDLEQKAREKADLETSYKSATQNLDWQTQKADLDIQRARADYNTYTWQNQVDFNQSIKNSNRDFSTALSQASSAYGKRGLLNSWIQKTQTADTTWQFVNDTNYFKTLNQRKLDDASLNMSRAESDYNTNAWQIQTLKQRATDQYNTWTWRIWTDILNYQSDRSAGSKALEYNLQSQWDALFNSSMNAIQANNQKQAELNRINQLYGIKTTWTRPVYRSGWTYTY